MTSQQLFPVKVSTDNMTAFIPEQTKLNADLEKLSFDEFSEYLSSIGFKLKPKLEIYYQFIELVRDNSNPLSKAFVVIQGRPSMAPRGAVLKWLQDPTKGPTDLVKADVPFGKLYPARGPLPKVDVFGTEDNTGLEQYAATDNIEAFNLPETLYLDLNNQVYAKQSGQVFLKENSIEFNPFYTITEIRQPYFQHFHFPCSVVIPGELTGDIHWTIEGSLTVQGVWCCSHIKVTKDAFAKSGIQTNSLEADTLVIEGSLFCNYIQNSYVNVSGKLTANAIINSIVVVDGGDLDCRQEPGKILNSKITLKSGAIYAKSTQGNAKTPTFINLQSEESASHSLIESAGEGTTLQVKKIKKLIESSGPWPNKRTKP